MHAFWLWGVNEIWKDRECKLDSFFHLVSLTSSTLSDSPLVCFRVAINGVKLFCGCADIPHLFLNQLIASSAARTIPGLWLCPWPPWQTDCTQCMAFLQSLYFYQFLSHNTPIWRGQIWMLFIVPITKCPHLRECTQQYESNWKGLNCWAPLYFMLPVNISILFITICGSVFCNHKNG